MYCLVESEDEMKFTIERSWVNVVGKGWYGQTIATTYNLSSYDLKNIGEETRENVERWLGSHAGDFQKVEDFRAVLKNSVVEWGTIEGELSFMDCMNPSED